MAKRIGVFCDLSNLYYCVGHKFAARKLDYRKYIKFVKDLGEITQAVAYGAQMHGQANGFIYCLERLGFKIKFKNPKSYQQESGIKRKADWDVGITMDIVNMIDRLDLIILGTGDGDMVPVVEWARMKGVDVVVFAATISKDLKLAATKFIEIPESLLEDIKPAGAKTPADMIDDKIANGETI
jgi:uncharacterized LabA/DUF88 family protein